MRFHWSTKAAWFWFHRFLIRPNHEHDLVHARPVGAAGIRVGPTGGPTPHPAPDEPRHTPGSKSRRHAAASPAALEGTQSGLPLFQPAQGGTGRSADPALGSHPPPLPRTGRVSADRRHDPTGLLLPPGHRGSGTDWQWRRPGPAAAHHAGRAGGTVDAGAAARRHRPGIVLSTKLGAHGTAPTGPGNLAAKAQTPAPIAMLDGGTGSDAPTPAGQPVDFSGRPGSRLLRTHRTLSTERRGLHHPQLPGSGADRCAGTFAAGRRTTAGPWHDVRDLAGAPRRGRPHGHRPSAQRLADPQRPRTSGRPQARLHRERGGSTRNQRPAGHRRAALDPVDLAALRTLGRSPTDRGPLHRPVVDRRISQSPQEWCRRGRQPDGSGVSDRNLDGRAGDCGRPVVERAMAGAGAPRRSGGSGRLRTARLGAPGGRVGRAARGLDAAQRIGGRGTLGWLSGAQRRWTTRLANHLARLAAFDVDVPRIRNFATLMKKMWVMTRASARFNTRIGEVLTNFQPDSCKPLKRRERRAPIVLFDLYAFVSIRG